VGFWRSDAAWVVWVMLFASRLAAASHARLIERFTQILCFRREQGG
jgi:hypothetical protein